MYSPKVTKTQRTSLERPILDQILDISVKLSDRLVLRKEGVME